MLIDTAIVSLVSVLFAVLLLWASFHKFADRLRFQGILAAYQILPGAVLPLAATAIPLLELVLGLAWITGVLLLETAVATAILMAAYASVMGINIARGNIHIDCGCGFSSGSQKAPGYQKLSMGLIGRNIVLMALALLILFPSNERLLGTLDYFSIAAACLGIFLLYAAFNQLLANRQIIDSWRQPLLQQEHTGGEHA